MERAREHTERVKKCRIVGAPGAPGTTHGWDGRCHGFFSKKKRAPMVCSSGDVHGYDSLAGLVCSFMGMLFS